MNRQVLLARYPVGMPQESDFEVAQSAAPVAQEDELLIRTLYISVDPYLRPLLRNAPRSASYTAGFSVGKPVASGAVGEVLESRSGAFQPGDKVHGVWNWQETVSVKAKDVEKVDEALGPLSTALGVLGMPGMTAYFGLLEIGQPKAGETVLVSGAAGAVGSLVGQIAKIQGCRVVGIAGTDEKVKWLTGELGFDAAFNYQKERNLSLKLRQTCPSGIDCYFDNVGGKTTDAVFPLLNTRSRVALCGQISQYNSDEAEMAPRLLFHLVVKQARAEGFLAFQFAERYPEGKQQMAEWIREGKLRYREDIMTGIEQTPKALIAMLSGANMGKMLVKLA